MQQRIKYPVKSFGIARKNGYDKEYLFYLQLKGLNDHGLFKKGSYLKEIKSKLGYSYPYISRMMNSLVYKGFARKLNRFGFQLISYNQVWSEKMNLEWKQRKHQLTFPIQEIYTNRKELKLFCQYSDIAYQVHRQKFAKTLDFEIKSRDKTEVTYPISPLHKEVVTGEISHFKIAREVLGYKTAMSSVQILNKLEQEGLVEITRNSIILDYESAIKLAETKFVEHNKQYGIRGWKRKTPFSRYCTWIKNTDDDCITVDEKRLPTVVNSRNTVKTGLVQVRLCNKITILT